MILRSRRRFFASLAVFAVLVVSASAAIAPNESANSGQDILKWLESVKFPALHGCPYIKVTITEKNPPVGQAPIVVRIDGIRLKETEKELTVFVLELEENLHNSYPMMDPPFWPLRVNIIKKDLPTESVQYKVVGYDAEAATVRKELQLADSGKTNEKLWSDGVFRHLPKPAAIALFASACRQNERERMAAELINGINRKYERYLSTDRIERPFGQFLENAISETLVWHATLQFGDPTVSRAQLLTMFRDLKERFPHSRYQELMNETTAKLEPMVREDEQHQSRPLAQVTEDEKITELIFRLRDQSGAQQMQPGWCNIFASDDATSGPSPAEQLVQIGCKAVPKLIDALDDSRFTRSIHFHRGFYFSHYVLRASDCAVQILERIAGRSFYQPKSTGSDMTSDNEVASTRQAVEKWWTEFQKKGEKQSLIDAVRSGDENSPDQAEKLLEKYRDSAAEAIMAGVQASKRDDICAALLALTETIEGDEVVAFLRKKMKDAPGLGARLAAARRLFNRGKAEAVTAMIEEWNHGMSPVREDKPYSFGQGGRESLIEFLANSGRVDAIKVLEQSLHGAPTNIRMAIISGFAPNEHKLGMGSWTARSSAASLKRETPPPDTGVDHASEALIVSVLDDKSLLSISGGLGEKNIYYTTPRLCDFAGFVLAKRWPQKYKFYWSLYWTENDRQLREEQDLWRNKTGSPRATPSSDEGQNATVEGNARLSPTQVREINIDSQGDTKTERQLRSLQGGSLTSAKLIQGLRFLTNNLPKNTRGFCFSAERTGGKPGFVINVRWLEGPRRSGESGSGSEVIVENAQIEGRPFETDEYKDLADKFTKAEREDPAKSIAVHFFAAPTPGSKDAQ